MDITLYKIRADHSALLKELEEAEGIITPEMEQALSLTNEQFHEKAISYGYVTKFFDDRVDTIEKEIARLQALKAKAEKNQQVIKDRLLAAMDQFGVDVINSATLKISVSSRSAVEVTDEKQIPVYLVRSRVTKTVDKETITKLLKNGDTVPGARLKTNKHLIIK